VRLSLTLGEPGLEPWAGKAGRFTYLLEVLTAVSNPSRFTRLGSGKAGRFTRLEAYS
jgi:hypothetical protein